MSTSNSNESNEFLWCEPPFPKPAPPSSLHHSLQQYEVSSLHCPSCHCMYDNAISLRPCHHSFCNQCIRRHLNNAIRNGVKKKRDCPVCHAKIEIPKIGGGVKMLEDDEAIIPNYGLQKAVDEYKQFRHKLYDTLVELQTLKQSSACHSVTGSNSTMATTSSAAMSLVSQNSKRMTNVVENESSPNKRPKRKCASNTLSYVEIDVESPERNHVVEDKVQNGNSVSHGDDKNNIPTQTRCDEKVETPSVVNPTLNSIPAVVRLERKSFNLVGKKRKDLIQMCKQEGIDSTGSEMDLKDRIQRFSDFWKSECDREEHKPRAQVLNEFRRQEEIRKVEEQKLKYSLEKRLVTKLNESREAAGSGDIAGRVTSGNVTFDKKTSKGFRKLISILGKQKKYESFHDMVSKVCARTDRKVPDKLPNWNFNTEEDDDDDNHDNCNGNHNDSHVRLEKPMVSGQALQSSSQVCYPRGNNGSTAVPLMNPYQHSNYGATSYTAPPSSLQTVSYPYHTRNPNTSTSHHPMSRPGYASHPYPPTHHPYQQATTNLSTRNLPLSAPHHPMPSPGYAVNPYQHTTHVSTTLQNRSMPQGGISNPYENRNITVSTPTNSKSLYSPSCIVSDTQPSSSSVSTGTTPIPMSQRKPSQPQQPTANIPNHENSQPTTWTCEFCTFLNTVKKWSRSKRRCAMCEKVPTKPS